jgi:Anti-sigma-K factor rskA
VEHVDPEVLALVALGEPATEAVRAHLGTCARCAAEVASLARTVVAARSVRPTDAPVAPSPAVWDRVRAELGLDAAPAPAPGTTAAAVAPTDTGTPPAGDRALAPVVPLRRRVVPWVAAAAACGVVVGGVGVAWWASRDTGTAQPDVVAEAELDPLPGWDATGAARVEVARDGVRTLVVRLRDAGADEGYHEVWLIDREVTRLVSLGVLDGTEGRFTVPSDLDLDEFPVVDVSDEPLDGNPAHSGDSITRGVLGS